MVNSFDDMAQEGQEWWTRGNPSVSGPLIMQDENTTVSLQCGFRKPGNYTVQFSTTPAVDSSTLAPIRSQPEALILWSVGGNSIQRRVSVGNGVSVSGAAEAVQVKLYDNTTDSQGAITDGPIQYQVQAIVVPGVRAAVSQPPTLLANDTNFAEGMLTINPNTTSPALAIPLDAGVISMQVAVQAQAVAGAVIPWGTVIVRQQVSGGTPRTLKECDPRDFEWIQLNQGCDQIEIRNSNAFPIIVNVAFGIDG